MAGKSNDYSYYMEALRRDALTRSITSRKSMAQIRIRLDDSNHREGAVTEELAEYLGLLTKTGIIKSYDIEYVEIGYDPYEHSNPGNCPQSYYNLVIFYKPENLTKITTKSKDCAPEKIFNKNGGVHVKIKNMSNFLVCKNNSRHGRLLLMSDKNSNNIGTIDSVYKEITRDRTDLSPEFKLDKIKDAEKQINRCLRNCSIKDRRVNIEVRGNEHTNGGRVFSGWVPTGKH